jgi:hypothetical protein
MIIAEKKSYFNFPLAWIDGKKIHKIIVFLSLIQMDHQVLGPQFQNSLFELLSLGVSCELEVGAFINVMLLGAKTDSLFIFFVRTLYLSSYN